MNDTKYKPFINQNLFSNYYLENLISRNIEWASKEHENVFTRIKSIYTSNIGFYQSLNEPDLEDKFFRKIFNIIQNTYAVQEPTVAQDLPDYAFFKDTFAMQRAYKNKGTKSFYLNAIVVGEVKRWELPLDIYGKDRKNQRRNPSFQIWLYLHETEPEWGILSNGRLWRLYHQKKQFDCYYEVDLVSILENDDVDGFKFFYYFFRKHAFIPGKKGYVFLNKVYEESLDYAKEVGDNLKENVYRAMKKIADGFFNWNTNILEPQNIKHRLEVHKVSMRLLYRILFLLYAEGKNLLDLENKQYRDKYSLYRLKSEIKEKKEGPENEYYSIVNYDLYTKLNVLSDLIHQGSEAFRLDPKTIFIPPYNGRLFAPELNPNLVKWKIGNAYLADAIDLLARSEFQGELVFVDYSTLQIRHLGSIYEGLLEYKLELAYDDMIVEGSKTRIWVKLKDYNGTHKKEKKFEDFDEFDRVRSGEIYLVTDKGERRLTGSYYTPDEVVEFIVKNTLEYLLLQKWKEALKNSSSLIDATLSIKVLDPAMGSGHFLIGAMDYLASKLLQATQKDIDRGLIKDDGFFKSEWARREIVSHCLYGVDNNELAVELAKLSLWLASISKDKPLSFLDHRLKLGNSLLGVGFKNLSIYPFEKKEKTQTRLEIPRDFVKKLTNGINKIDKLDDNNIENIRKKSEIFDMLKNTFEYNLLKSLCNLRASLFYNKLIDAETYNNFIGFALQSNDEQRQKFNQKSHIKMANEMAGKKNFFHWSLEFPEIFFKEGEINEERGFDAVIGNPPYGTITIKNDRPFLEANYPQVNDYENFQYFIVKAIKLLKKKSFHSFIVPNTFGLRVLDKNFRDWILKKSSIISIQDYSELPIFEDPKVRSMIYILLKNSTGKPCQIKVFKSDKTYRELKVKYKDLYDSQDWTRFLKTDPALDKIINKIKTRSIPLKVIAESKQGYIPYRLTTLTRKFGKDKAMHIKKTRAWHSDKKIDDTYKRELQGSDVTRYNVNWSGVWAKYGKWVSTYVEMKFFNQPRLLFREITRTMPYSLIVAYSEEEFINNPSVITAYKKEPDCNKYPEYSLYTALAILNSSLISLYFVNTAPKAKKGLFPKIIIQDVRELPIYKFQFTTPDTRKAEKLDDFINLYKNFTSNNDSNLIEIEIDKLVSNGLEDLIHEYLNFLSHKVIELKNNINIEINNFLDWLKTKIGQDLEKLKNKTKIKTYYKDDFDTFLDILKSNRKILSIDPMERQEFEVLKKEFENSVINLNPLINNVKNIELLIDKIVYKLYNLTKNEIEKIEEFRK